MRLDDLILINHLLTYEDLTPKILLDTLEQAVEQLSSNPHARESVEDIRFNPLFQILVKCLIKHDSMNLYLQTINNSRLTKLEKIYDILLEIYLSSKKNTISSTINTDSEILLDIVDSIKALDSPENDSNIIDFCGLAYVQARSLSKYLYNIIIAKFPPSIPRLRFIIHTSSSFSCLISAKHLASALSQFFDPQRITFSLKTDNFLNDSLLSKEFSSNLQSWADSEWPYTYEKNWDSEKFGNISDDSKDLNILSKRCITGLQHLIDYYNNKTQVSLHESDAKSDFNSCDDTLNVLLVITHGSLISNYLNNYSNSLILENFSKKKNNGTVKNKYNNMKVLPSSFVFLQNCTTTEESEENKSENDSWILEYSNINFQCFKKRLFFLHENNGNQQTKNLNFYNYAKIVEFKKFNLIPEELYDLNNSYLTINNNSGQANAPFLDHVYNNQNDPSNSENDINGFSMNLQEHDSPRFDFCNYNTSSSSIDSEDNGMENSTPSRSRDRRNTVLTTTTSISHIATHEEDTTLKKTDSSVKLATNSANLSSGDHISGYDFSQSLFKFDNINDIVDQPAESSIVNQSLINFTYNNNNSSSFDDQIVTSKKDSRNFENASYLSKFSNKFTNLHLAANNSSSWSQLDIFGAPRICILSNEGLWAKKNRHGKFILHTNGVDSLNSHKEYPSKSNENVVFYLPDDDNSSEDEIDKSITDADKVSGNCNEAEMKNSTNQAGPDSIKEVIPDSKLHASRHCPHINTSVSDVYANNDSVPKAFTPIAKKFKDRIQHPNSSSNMLENDPLNENDDDALNEIYGANVANEGIHSASSYRSTGDLKSLAIIPESLSNSRDVVSDDSTEIDQTKHKDISADNQVSSSSNSQRRNRIETVSLPIVNDDNDVNSALKEIQNNFNFFKKIKKENGAFGSSNIIKQEEQSVNNDYEHKSSNFENARNVVENLNKKKSQTSQVSDSINKLDSNNSLSKTNDKYFVQKDNVFYFKQQTSNSTNYRNQDHKLNEIISDEDNDGELYFAEDNDDDSKPDDRLVSSMKAFDERAAYFNNAQSNDFFASLNNNPSNLQQLGIQKKENVNAVTKTQKTLFKKFDYMPAMTRPVPATHGKKLSEVSNLAQKSNNTQLQSVQTSDSTSPKPLPDQSANVKAFYGTAKLPSSTRYNDLVHKHNTSEENKIIFVSNANETSRYDIY